MSLIDVELGRAETFPDAPFRIRHHLTGHPLLSLEALAKLATKLDRDRLEYNSGKLQPNQKPDEVPGIDLAPVDVIRQIETAGAWMVLKNVEAVPEYAALIRAALADAVESLGADDPGKADTGFRLMQERGASAYYWIDNSYGCAIAGTAPEEKLKAVAALAYRQLLSSEPDTATR